MRQYDKELAQFLHVALGSCGELDTQVIIAERLGYLGTEHEITERIDHIGRMLRNLAKCLK